MVKSYFFNGSTIVAMLLLLATLLAWLIFEGYAENFYTSWIIIVIALLKVRAILYSFMELACQDLVWRLVFNAWLGVVGTALIFSSFSSHYSL